MELQYLVFVKLLCFVFLTHGSTALGDTRFSNGVSVQSSSANISLIAPYYHPVTAGSVWVYPKSDIDLGARSMSCECFDPTQTCCMPTSPSIPPFCASQGSTCCGNTYCNSGETCCDGACCPSMTTCNGPGCCPLNTTCSGPPTCYDHSSSTCSNVFSSPQQCCPAALPYCRAFPPYGYGCFASSVLSTALATVTDIMPSSNLVSLTDIISASGTGDAYGTISGRNSEPSITRISTTTITMTVTAILSENNNTMNSSTSSSCLEPTSMDSALTASPTSTVFETLTLSIIPLGSNHFTYQFPYVSTSSSPSAIVVVTTWDIDILPTSSTSTSTPTSNSTSSSAPTSATAPSTTSTSTSAKTKSPTTKTSLSALCFNTDLQTDLPCSPSAATSSSNTATDVGYFPPGSSIVTSGVNGKKLLSSKSILNIVLILFVIYEIVCLFMAVEFLTPTWMLTGLGPWLLVFGILVMIQWNLV